MNIKKKLHYSLDLGLFLSGIFLILLGTKEQSDISSRAIIGEIAIVASYMLFPFINPQKKEKIGMMITAHFVFILVSLIITCLSLSVYVKNMDGAVLWQEVLAAVGIIVVTSYLSYILINFIRSFYILSSKIISFLLCTNVKETYSNTLKIIEKITALIVTITALAASITALIASYSNMIGNSS